jgi:hypothetical protein
VILDHDSDQDGDDDSMYSESYAHDSDSFQSDAGRDSEAFGYWHMSVIPTNQALVSGDVSFYLKAMKVLSRTKSQAKLDRLRKCVWDTKPSWNYTQKKTFWAAHKLKCAQAKGIVEQVSQIA